MSFQKIQALSFDLDFKDFVLKSKGKRDIYIHSIFKRVINIISSDNILYTVSNISTDNAPYTLKTDFKGNFNEEITKEDKIIIGDKSIEIGSVRIDLSDIVLWNPIGKKVRDYSDLNIEKNIKIFDSLIVDNGESGGCKYYYLKNFLNISADTTNPVEDQLSKRIDEFYKSLLDNNLDVENIKNLIGLGIGLTPSGDDFLTGFLASLSVFEKNKDLHDKISFFIKPLIHSTTDISAAMLKASIEGKYRELLSEFIYSFLESDVDNFTKSFNNLLSIGSSSGTDMIIGAVLGIHYSSIATIY
jgi:hypothetical protein